MDKWWKELPDSFLWTDHLGRVKVMDALRWGFCKVEKALGPEDHEGHEETVLHLWEDGEKRFLVLDMSGILIGGGRGNWLCTTIEYDDPRCWSD